MNIKKLNCKFCKKKYADSTIEAINGSYGCDTGCEYYHIILTCPHCHRSIVLEKSFGSDIGQTEIDELVANYDEKGLQKLIDEAEEYD